MDTIFQIKYFASVMAISFVGGSAQSNSSVVGNAASSKSLTFVTQLLEFPLGNAETNHAGHAREAHGALVRLSI